MKLLWIGLCCTALLGAWPAPERVVIDHRVYSLLRYELTPLAVQGYGESQHDWWGTLRELDADAHQQGCDGFLNNDAVCAPHVRNVIGSPIPNDVAKASTADAVKWLLGTLVTYPKQK